MKEGDLYRGVKAEYGHNARLWKGCLREEEYRHRPNSSSSRRYCDGGEDANVRVWLLEATRQSALQVFFTSGRCAWPPKRLFSWVWRVRLFDLGCGTCATASLLCQRPPRQRQRQGVFPASKGPPFQRNSSTRPHSRCAAPPEECGRSAFQRTPLPLRRPLSTR